MDIYFSKKQQQTTTTTTPKQYLLSVFIKIERVTHFGKETRVSTSPFVAWKRQIVESLAVLNVSLKGTFVCLFVCLHFIKKTFLKKRFMCSDIYQERWLSRLYFRHWRTRSVSPWIIHLKKQHTLHRHVGYYIYVKLNTWSFNIFFCRL